MHMRMKREGPSYADMVRPPCWPANAQCPNSCAAALHERIARNHTYLHGPWAGWRMAGRELVSPTGKRITTGRLEGLLWQAENQEQVRLAKMRNDAKKAVRQGGVKVLVVPNEDWHRRHFGTSAG